MDQWDSSGIGLRVQKKLLGKMTNRKIAKSFIDDTTGRMLDNLHRLTKRYAESKKAAEKITKNLIKIVIKLGILHKNEQLTTEDLNTVSCLRRKLRTVCMTVISFHEVDFSYDQPYLSAQLHECAALLRQVVSRHLTEKSVLRSDSMFDFYSRKSFLDQVFEPGGPSSAVLASLCADLNKMVENGSL